MWRSEATTISSRRKEDRQHLNTFGRLNFKNMSTTLAGRGLNACFGETSRPCNYEFLVRSCRHTKALSNAPCRRSPVGFKPLHPTNHRTRAYGSSHLRHPKRENLLTNLGLQQCRHCVSIKFRSTTSQAYACGHVSRADGFGINQWVPYCRQYCASKSTEIKLEQRKSELNFLSDYREVVSCY